VLGNGFQIVVSNAGYRSGAQFQIRLLLFLPAICDAITHVVLGAKTKYLVLSATRSPWHFNQGK